MTDPLLGWTFWMQYGVINMRCKQTIPNLVNQNSVTSEGAPHAWGSIVPSAPSVTPAISIFPTQMKTRNFTPRNTTLAQRSHSTCQSPASLCLIILAL